MRLHGPTVQPAFRFARLLALSVLILLPAGSLAGQDAGGREVPINPEYEAGGLYRFLFGSDYRKLWTVRTRVEVLDLHRFGGGLTPVSRGGGQQTKSLRLGTPGGRLFNFRSVDKDPSAVLPPDLQGTIADEIIQDQISSGLPTGPLVVAPLLEAAGVLHVQPQLYLMPDDPVLGEHRRDFAGLIGMLEPQLEEGETIAPGLPPIARIISMPKLLDRLENHPAERIDTTAWLRARLMDVFIGDWDRHRGQWRWVQLGNSDWNTPWLPVPEDRDQAFIRFDGLFLTVARNNVPQLVKFGPGYSWIVGATWNGRELDRRLLSGLEWSRWDSVAADLQQRLSDQVIGDAVHRLPPEHYALEGTRLTANLKSRRDRLRRMARDYYRYVSSEVDIHASDEADRAVVSRLEDGRLEVSIRSSEKIDGQEVEVEPFRRVFLPAETNEIRLYLHGGDDAVTLLGAGPGRIRVRVIGGGGDDRVTDSSRAGGVLVYDDRGNNTVGGLHRPSLDTRTYRWPDTTSVVPPRDWGRVWFIMPWMNGGPDVGAFGGIAITRTGFGFRKDPYASRYRLRAGWATGAQTYRTDFTADWRFTNSKTRLTLLARASGIEILRFYGFGNETSNNGSNDFYKIDHNLYMLQPSLAVEPASGVTLSFGPMVKFSNLEANANRFIATLPGLYGGGEFGEAGARAGIEIDTRDVPAAPRRGLLLTLEGTVFPGIWDVTSTFGRVEGQAATYLSAGGHFRPVLALRAGGSRVFGDYPFHEAAYLGGRETLRGWQEQRFAGDAAAYGNAELRIHLTRTSILVPTNLGIFGLADVGRVYLKGETSDTWHTGFGGGISLGILSSANTVTVAVASSEERTGVYVRGGFLF